MRFILSFLFTAIYLEPASAAADRIYRDVTPECERGFIIHAIHTQEQETPQHPLPADIPGALRWRGFQGPGWFYQHDGPIAWSNKDHGGPWPGAGAIDRKALVLLGMIQAAHHYWSYPIQRKIFIDRFGEADAYEKFKEKFFEGFDEAYAEDEFILTFDQSPVVYGAEFFDGFFSQFRLPGRSKKIKIPLIVGFTRISTRTKERGLPWERFMTEKKQEEKNELEYSDDSTWVEASRLMTAESPFGTESNLILLTHYSHLFARLARYTKDQRSPIVLAAALTSAHVRYFQKFWNFTKSNIPPSSIVEAPKKQDFNFVLMESRVGTLVKKLASLVSDSVARFQNVVLPTLDTKRTSANEIDAATMDRTLLYANAHIGGDILHVYVRRSPDLNGVLRPRVLLQGSGLWSNSTADTFEIIKEEIDDIGSFDSSPNSSNSYVARRGLRVGVNFTVTRNDGRRFQISLSTVVPRFSGKVWISMKNSNSGGDFQLRLDSRSQGNRNLEHTPKNENGHEMLSGYANNVLLIPSVDSNQSEAGAYGLDPQSFSNVYSSHFSVAGQVVDRFRVILLPQAFYPPTHDFSYRSKMSSNLPNWLLFRPSTHLLSPQDIAQGIPLYPQQLAVLLTLFWEQLDPDLVIDRFRMGN